MFFEISRFDNISVMIDFLKEAQDQGFTLADIAIGTDVSPDRDCFVLYKPQKGIDQGYLVN